MQKPRIPPHPTTKQEILFLRRMGFPAQKKMKNFLRNMASLIIAVAMNMAALIIAVAMVALIIVVAMVALFITVVWMNKMGLN